MTTRHFATDRLTLDAPRRTNEGYLTVRARAARSGVYDYLASEVGAPASFRPTDTVKVYRDPEEVFAADAVRSFIGRPITNDHPREAVSAANWRDHARGVVMGAMRDGEYLSFDLVLMDAGAIDAVQAGKREISNGYACTLDWTPGTAPDGSRFDARQVGIRGNHCAIVDAGRAGPNCAIRDGASFALCDAGVSPMQDIHAAAGRAETAYQASKSAMNDWRRELGDAAADPNSPHRLAMLTADSQAAYDAACKQAQDDIHNGWRRQSAPTR